MGVVAGPLVVLFFPERFVAERVFRSLVEAERAGALATRAAHAAQIVQPPSEQ